MTVTCICKFENKDASFYSGKTMSGTVSLTFTKPISIKGCYFLLICENCDL